MSKPSHVSAPPVENAAGLSERYIRAVVPEAMQASDSVARYFVRRRIPFDPDEIRNQAFVVCMESMKDYDPAKGDVVPYMFGAAKTAVGMTMARWFSPVSVSDSQIKTGKKIRPERARRRGNDDEEEHDPIESLPAAGPTPEEAVERSRRVQEHEAARRRYEGALLAELRTYYRPDVRAALADVVGIGRRSRTVQEAAERYRVDGRYLTREYLRLRKWMFGSVEVNVLRREMDALDPEAL